MPFYLLLNKKYFYILYSIIFQVFMVSPSNDFVMLSIFISSSSSISGQWRSGRTERLKFHFLSCQISVIIPFFIQFSCFSLLVCSLFTSSFAFLNLSLIIFSSILFGSLCDGARISKHKDLFPITSP